MIDFEVKGAIFDVDDTLLDNQSGAKAGVYGLGLHERSRLSAFHTVGERHQLPELIGLTREENFNGFITAPAHTLDAAVWHILGTKGLTDSEIIDPDNPLFQEIVSLKNELYIDILRAYGREVPGSTKFVRNLADQKKLHDVLAVASTAIHRDIGIYFDMVGLTDLFPNKRIVSYEMITHPKPHPEAFNLAFTTLGLPETDRKHVCAFEDDPRGIMAAKAAGLFTCAITTRYSADSLAELEVAPDLIADSFTEFAEHFNLKS